MQSERGSAFVSFRAQAEPGREDTNLLGFV